MKILLFGYSHGFLAQQIHAYFKGVGENIRWLSQFDFGNDDLKKIIEQSAPTVIINAVGETDIEWCEKNRDEAFMVNSAAVMRLACICHQYGISFVHFSTGEIFRGDTWTGFFTEASEPCPDSWYAKTRLYAEEFIRDATDDYLILRICFPISSHPHPENFLDRCATYEKLSRTETSVTILDDLIPVMHRLLFSRFTGTFNCVNAGTISPFQLRQMIDGNEKEYPEDFNWDGVCMYTRELVAKGFELPSLFANDHLERIITIWKERRKANGRCHISRR